MAFQTRVVNYKSLDAAGLSFGDGIALLPLTTAQAAAATPTTGTYAFDTDKSRPIMAQSDNTYHAVTEIPHWSQSIAGPLSVPDATVYYIDVSSPVSSFQIPTNTSGNTGVRLYITQGIVTVSVSGEFAANATGERYLGISAVETGGTVEFSRVCILPARSSGTTYISLTCQFIMPAERAMDYVYFTAFQSSGGNLNLSNVRANVTISGTAQNIQYSL